MLVHRAGVGLGWVISQFFYSWVVLEVEHLLSFLIQQPKNLISMDLDLCLFMVLFTIPTPVELSIFIGVGGCGSPSSSNINLITFAFFVFRNKAPSSASAAHAATCFNMVHMISMLPFNLMSFSFTGKLLKKKYPPALLLALDANRYNASECIFKIMSEA